MWFVDCSCTYLWLLTVYQILIFLIENVIIFQKAQSHISCSTSPSSYIIQNSWPPLHGLSHSVIMHPDEIGCLPTNNWNPYGYGLGSMGWLRLNWVYEIHCVDNARHLTSLCVWNQQSPSPGHLSKSWGLGADCTHLHNIQAWGRCGLLIVHACTSSGWPQNVTWQHVVCKTYMYKTSMY